MRLFLTCVRCCDGVLCCLCVVERTKRNQKKEEEEEEALFCCLLVSLRLHLSLPPTDAGKSKGKGGQTKIAVDTMECSKVRTVQWGMCADQLHSQESCTNSPPQPSLTIRENNLPSKWWRFQKHNRVSMCRSMEGKERQRDERDSHSHSHSHSNSNSHSHVFYYLVMGGASPPI